MWAPLVCVRCSTRRIHRRQNLPRRYCHVAHHNRHGSKAGLKNSRLSHCQLPFNVQRHYWTIDIQPIAGGYLYLSPPYQVPNQARDRRSQGKPGSSQGMLPRFVRDRRKESNDDNQRMKNPSRAIRRIKHNYLGRRVSRENNQNRY